MTRGETAWTELDRLNLSTVVGFCKTGNELCNL